MRKNLNPLLISQSLILVFFLNLFSISCTTVKPVVKEIETGNKNITVENLLKVVKGKTTVEEIRQIFGEPTKITTHPDTGNLHWIYVHTLARQNSTERSPFQLDQTELELIFNDKGIVREYIQTVSNRLKKSE